MTAFKDTRTKHYYRLRHRLWNVTLADVPLWKNAKREGERCRGTLCFWNYL